MVPTYASFWLAEANCGSELKVLLSDGTYVIQYSGFRASDWQKRQKYYMKSGLEISETKIASSRPKLRLQNHRSWDRDLNCRDLNWYFFTLVSLSRLKTKLFKHDPKNPAKARTQKLANLALMSSSVKVVFYWGSLPKGRCPVWRKRMWK